MEILVEKNDVQKKKANTSCIDWFAFNVIFIINKINRKNKYLLHSDIFDRFYRWKLKMWILISTRYLLWFLFNKSVLVMKFNNDTSIIKQNNTKYISTIWHGKEILNDKSKKQLIVNYQHILVNCYFKL